MKKYVSLSFCFIFAFLCACSEQQTSDTQFLFDTVVTLSADCDEATLSGAFDLCRKLENTLSITKEESDVYKLNRSKNGVKVTDDTKILVEKALYFCKLSGGKFDITVYPLSSLWNIKEEVVPSKDEIAEALKNVDYESVSVTEDSILTEGKQIDLGGIAKGYIAEKTLEYFKNKGVKTGIINMGGNIIVFGDKDYTVGIKEPFSDNGISATLKLRNKSVVTSGVYERCFKKDGKLYHHIIDTKTGYPADTDLLSATIICDDSTLGDAFSTICILYGKEAATEFIESRRKIDKVEAVFIDKDYNITYTSGIKKDGKYLVLK